MQAWIIFPAGSFSSEEVFTLFSVVLWTPNWQVNVKDLVSVITPHRIHVDLEFPTRTTTPAQTDRRDTSPTQISLAILPMLNPASYN